MAEIHFRSMEASENKSDVTIKFLVGGLVISLCRNFPSILFRSKVIQEFDVCSVVKKLFQFWGANLTPKIFFAIIDTPKGTSLRKSASIQALWSRWLFQFGL
jgi:hypothetical protein